MQVSYEQIIEGIHTSYGNQIKSLVTDNAMLAAANSELEKRSEEQQGIINSLNEEVRTLRGAQAPEPA